MPTWAIRLQPSLGSVTWLSIQSVDIPAVRHSDTGQRSPLRTFIYRLLSLCCNCRSWRTWRSRRPSSPVPVCQTTSTKTDSSTFCLVSFTFRSPSGRHNLSAHSKYNACSGRFRFFGWYIFRWACSPPPPEILDLCLILQPFGCCCDRTPKWFRSFGSRDGRIKPVHRACG